MMLDCLYLLIIYLYTLNLFKIYIVMKFDRFQSTIYFYKMKKLLIKFLLTTKKQELIFKHR